MRRSDYIFYLTIGAGFLYILYFLYLVSNIKFWLEDLETCYFSMDRYSFFINHVHIYFYLLSFPFVLYFLTKTFLKGYFHIKKYIQIKSCIKTAKIKEIKNIIIVDFKGYTAFNIGLFSRKLVFSKDTLNLPKEDKKIIFAHEKAHFKHRDSLKFFLFSVFAELFPFSKKMKENFFLLKEIEADMSVDTDRLRYAELLLNFYQSKIKGDIPLAGGYINRRFEFILEGKRPEFSIYFLLPSAFFIFFLLSFVFKTCFCGEM